MPQVGILALTFVTNKRFIGWLDCVRGALFVARSFAL